jgi:hypothetical protein
MRTKAAIILLLLIIPIPSCDSVEPPDNGTDTTSHNFTFQTWTFGEHSSSSLYDVAILSDTSIWVVGEIYLNDSLGQPDPTPYNAAHWNGTDWDITRIPTKTFSGSIVSSQIRTVFAFNENDIWTFSIAGSYSYWNGSNWETEFVSERDGTGNKFLGTSSSDLYLVCSNGGISYYNGTSWQKIESGTELNIYDIYGQKKTNGEYEIICVAADQSVSTEKKIMRIENNVVVTLSSSGIPYSIRGIWFKPNSKYFVVGSGMFSKTDINSNQGWTSVGEGITQYYINSIDGSGLNDIVVCGAFGELLHFNGKSWQSFQSEVQLQAGSYRKIKMKDNFIIAVGYDSPKAVITIGKRE